MTANLTDNFLQVAADGGATILPAPGKQIGDTSLLVTSTTGFPTATAFIVAIRQVDASGNEVAGTYTEWIATVSTSTSLAINPAPVIGTDQVYSGGSTYQVYVPVSSYGYNKLINTLLTTYNQDGTFKTSLVTNSVLAPNSVTNSKLSTAAGEIGGASTAYTPTVIAQTGSITSYTSSGNYSVIGKLCFYSVVIGITDAGTGATALKFTIPLTAARIGCECFVGKESASTGKGVAGVNHGSNIIYMTFSNDNTYPGGGGNLISGNGFYEIA